MKSYTTEVNQVNADPRLDFLSVSYIEYWSWKIAQDTDILSQTCLGMSSHLLSSPNGQTVSHYISLHQIMATLHIKRDAEKSYTVTKAELDFQLIAAEIETERDSRNKFEDIRALCEVPGTTVEELLQKLRMRLSEWDDKISEREKLVKELEDKAVPLKPAGQRDGDAVFLTTETERRLRKEKTILDVEKSRRDVYDGDIKAWNVRGDGLLEIMKDVDLNLERLDNGIRTLTNQAAELADKIEQQELAEEVKLANPRRSEIPDPAEGGKRLDDIEKVQKEQEKVQKEQGKDIGVLKKDTQKNSEDIKANTERIDKLENPRPVLGKDGHPATHDSPSVAHVDHMKPKRPVAVLVEVDKGKKPAEQTTQSDAEGKDAKETQDSAQPPPASSKDAHSGEDAAHEKQSSKPVESQSQPKGKEVPHEPRPKKSESAPAKPPPPTQQLPADPKPANPPVEPKRESDTKVQPEPAADSSKSTEIAHKSDKPLPPVDQHKPPATEPQHKPDKQPVEHKEPTAAKPADTQPPAHPAPEHKDATTHARLDEHEAKIGTLGSDLKDVKEKQHKDTAKQTVEVKQLKENHQQQQVQIGKIEKDQAKTSGKLNSLQEDHDKLAKDSDVNQEDFVQHLDGLENRVHTTEQDIIHISQEHAAQGQRIGVLENKAIGFDQKFATIETEVGHLKGQVPKHDDIFMKVPALETHNDRTTQDLKLVKDKQDTANQERHSLKVELGQTQTEVKHAYEGLNKVDAKAEKANTGLTDLQQRVTTLELGKGGGPNWGLIVGGAVAAALAVGGAVGGWLLWKKKKAGAGKSVGPGDNKLVSWEAVGKGNGSKARQRNKTNRSHAREWFPAVD